MTLPLPRQNCTRLFLYSDLSLPMSSEGELQTLVQGTLNDFDELHNGEECHAVFASRYRVDDVMCRNLSSLRVQRSQSDLRVRMAVIYEVQTDDVVRPNRRVRSSLNFISHAADSLGVIEVNCLTAFEYARSKGFSSRIATLPAPLMVPDVIDGLTHLEEVTYSRRKDDEVEYSISATDTEEEDSFRHDVYFTEEAKLSGRMIRGLFNRARTISMRFVNQSGGK